MPGNPLSDPNWASDVADTIDRVVGQVRDKATLRVVTVVRALVFGLLIAFVGTALLILAIVAGVKLLQDVSQLVARDHETAVWVSYLLMSALLFLGGAICMRKRFTKANTE